MRWLVAAAAVGASLALAQSPCESRCHQEGAECLKTCAGEPRNGQNPDGRKKLSSCLSSCESRTTACKGGCGAPRPPAAADAGTTVPGG